MNEKLENSPKRPLRSRSLPRRSRKSGKKPNEINTGSAALKQRNPFYPLSLLNIRLKNEKRI